MFSFLLLAFSLSLPKRKNLKSKLSYVECFNFIRNIEDDIHNNVPVDQIKNKGQSYCNNLPDKIRQDFCSNLIQDDQFDKLYDFIKNQNMSPEAACSKMGYSRSFGRGKVITEEQCSNIIDAIKEELKKNPPQANSAENIKLDSKRTIKQQLNKMRPNSKISFANVCRKFDSNDKVTCQMISRIAYRTVFDDIMDGVDSIRICHRLQDLRKVQLAKDET